MGGRGRRIQLSIYLKYNPRNTVLRQEVKWKRTTERINKSTLDLKEQPLQGEYNVKWSSIVLLVSLLVDLKGNSGFDSKVCHVLCSWSVL